MSLLRPDIKDVFTPRRSSVNGDMYVKRAELEEELLDSIEGHMHTMLFGESGNGKSWLYKHVFQTNKVEYKVANCGNVARLNSVTQAIYDACIPEGYKENIELEEKKNAKANAYFLEGGVESTRSYQLQKKEPLYAAFKWLSDNYGSCVLVIENLEAINNTPALVEEMSSIILLLDDERYAELGVKLLIVGTPNGIGDFFGKVQNVKSVKNRVEELTKVSALNYGQIRDLVTKGFVKKLKVGLKPEEIEKISKEVYHKTLGLAQSAQELCGEIAKQTEANNWRYNDSLIAPAQEKWLKKSLRAVYKVIEKHLNSIETTVGRRNQVIYAIGKINKNPIYAFEVENFIRKEFPDTIPETNMGVGTILSELCSGEPILRKDGKAAMYYIVDPLYIICIRMILFKNKETGKVERKRFKTT